MKCAFLPTLLGLIVTASASVGAAPGEKAPKVISRGQNVELSSHLTKELATLFVCYKPKSTLEAEFVQELVRSAGPRVEVRLIHLDTGKEPVTQQYEILRTPTAIVMDRRGRITGRSSEAQEIRSLMARAAGVMRIDWAEPGTPLGDAADAASGNKGLKPGIMRTMSLQPDWLKDFFTMTRKAHFSDTALTRRHKEMIATYVSGLNKCKF
jgi:hypothetical protein